MLILNSRPKHQFSDVYNWSSPSFFRSTDSTLSEIPVKGNNSDPNVPISKSQMKKLKTERDMLKEALAAEIKGDINSAKAKLNEFVGRMYNKTNFMSAYYKNAEVTETKATLLGVSPYQ